MAHTVNDVGPNIVMIVSDEERRNDWLDGHASLPAHDRLRRDGLSFNRHYTHSSPCSPSRASLFTGRYLAQHGVVDNVNFPTHHQLTGDIPTIGNLLSGAGYRCAYFGKWHLASTGTPDMAVHGFEGWEGNDHQFVGGAWTQRYFDPQIVDQATRWIGERVRDEHDDRPWFVVVSLLGPHDIMWFPADQPWYQAANPDDARVLRAITEFRAPGIEFAPPPTDLERRFTDLPDNFDDDLHTKPEIQRAWRQVRNTEHFVGSIAPEDTETWLRQLDYYAWLHEQVDQPIDVLLDELTRLGAYDDSVVVYTSDHGDACGAHGLRAKLPSVYEEVMGVPLVVKVPGVTTPGTQTMALSTHVDLAATICSLGGVEPSATRTLAGTDLSPVLATPSASVRDHVLFAQDSAQSELLRSVRYAVRGFFDGTTKYARYYGVGGGVQRDGTEAPTPKLYDVDAAFDDHDHEWYELDDDPGELDNLANRRDRRVRTHELFERLLDYESAFDTID